MLDLLHGRLHVRQRAAGAALRHPRRDRQPVPARRGDRRGASRPARARQHAARSPRTRTARRRSSAASGCSRTCWARRRRRRRRTCRRSTRRRIADRPLTMKERMEEHRAQPGVRQLPPADGSDWPGARELRRRRRLADARQPACASTRPPSSPTAPTSTASSSCAAALLRRPEVVRADRDREPADLRARPRAHGRRHAGGARHHAQRRAAATTGCRISIEGIINSTPFTMRVKAADAERRESPSESN